MGNIISFHQVPDYKGGDDRMSKIKRERMSEIEKIVADLLKDNDFEKSPYVDIVSLVKKDGFEVEPEEMDMETTGCLLVSDDKKSKKRLIVVNTNFKNPENESDVVFKKSRFITAHEDGHFILHRKQDEPLYAHRDTYHRTEPIELEADYFARSILMPLDQFKIFCELLQQLGEDDDQFSIEMLSKVFKVTRNKVKKRMDDLVVLNS